MAWEDYVKEGKSVEARFARLLTNPVFASKEQDMTEHWDVSDNSCRYDVKGMKRFRRSDPEPTDRLHYIELRNVNGKVGWLYGKADYIAFETRSWWIVVDRAKLADFVEGAIWSGNDQFGLKPEPYKLIQREGRQDIITIVPTVDLLSIASQVLVKE
jgi:hypothetical protein